MLKITTAQTSSEIVYNLFNRDIEIWSQYKTRRYFLPLSALLGERVPLPADGFSAYMSLLGPGASAGPPVASLFTT